MTRSAPEVFSLKRQGWYLIRRLLLVVGVSVVCLLTAYFLANREVMSAKTARHNRKASVVALGNGTTHVQRVGDYSKDPLVVFLHGSTVAIWDFDLQREPFLASGFAQLRYDAFGRGLSDRPNVPYTRLLLVNQLRDLLDRLQVKSPVFLVGHSLGGAVAVSFAARYPERVKKIALIDPVVNQVTSRAPYVVCGLGPLARVVNRLVMFGVLRKRAGDQWPEVMRSRYDDLFMEQASIRGFETSVCSMFQTDLVGDYRPSYQLVGSRIQGLFIYGTDDPVIGLPDAIQMAKKMDLFKVVPISGAGHSPHVSHATLVNKLVIDFFKSAD